MFAEGLTYISCNGASAVHVAFIHLVLWAFKHILAD